MLIDWFTVTAQALNFLILVWLMKRFLYQPILNAIDAREKRIAAQIADAELVKSEATQQRDEYRLKNESFDGERSALMDKATEEVDKERRRLIEQAREAAENAKEKLAASLRTEHADLSAEIIRRTQDEVYAIARKTLTDLASADLEARMVDVFIRRLQGMDEKDRAKMQSAISSATEPALVRSAFELSGEQREALQQALNTTFSSAISPRFQVAPEVVSGIEFTTHGQKVAWSIADYLDSLEQSVAGLLPSTPTPISS